MSRNASKVGIYWAEVGLRSHPDLFTGARNHCPTGHGELRYERPNIRAKHRSQIVHKGFCCGSFTSWSMEKEVQPFLPVELMNNRHETILVFVVYIGSAGPLFL